MSAAAATSTRVGTSQGGSASLPRVVASEWTKLWSLRSTWWLLLIAVVLAIGLAAAIGSSISSATADGADAGQGGPPPEVLADPTALVLSGTGLSSLVLGVLGALTMSGEYSTGTISATVTAVPRRWMVVVAKVVVLVAVAAPVSLAMSVVSVVVGSALLPDDLAVGLGDAGVLEALVGSMGYLTAVTLLGLGLATILRSSAGTITLLVALVFVLPPLLGLIPWDWLATAADYFPSVAGGSLQATGPAAVLSDLASALTLTGWVVIPLLLGTALLARRDA